jgi:nucleotide-binding universal stress UspA family protein
MTQEKDYFGEQLHLAERAREDMYFRQLDQALIAQMRQQERVEPEGAAPAEPLFPSILVPVDFSAHSTVALHYAAGIADRCGSSVIALHVLANDVATHAVYHHLGHTRMPLPGDRDRADLPERPPEAAAAVATDLREHAYTALHAFLPPRLASHAVELRVVTGTPFARILETAVHARVALIVLGTHGRTGLTHAIMGSVAERVVRLAPCPVLTVKAATPAEKGWLQDIYGRFMSPPPAQRLAEEQGTGGRH